MNKVKYSGWVKIVAIIFLTVMLILTFFSNTIMNRSLPEVATQAVTSDSITAKIRGTGTVTANGSYEVMADSTRKVKTVMIKEGQEVNTGDILFILEAGASEELSAARDALRTAQKAYQEALINNADADYAKENRDIKLAREGLAEAQAKLEKLTVTEAELTQARQNAEYYKDMVDYYQNRVDKAKEDLADITGSTEGTSSAELEKKIEAASEALRQAKSNLDTAKLKYQDRYNFIKAHAKDAIEADGNPVNDYNISIYMPYIVYELTRQFPAYKPSTGADDSGDEGGETETQAANINITPRDETQKISDWKQRSHKNIDEFNSLHQSTDPMKPNYFNADDFSAAEYSEAYNAIVKCDNESISCEKTLNELIAQRSGSAVLEQYNNAVKQAEKDLEAVKESKTKADEALEALKTKQSDYEKQQTEVKTLESGLEDKLFALAEQQKTDNKQAQLAALNLQELAYNVSEAQKKLDALSGTDESANEIKASVSGIVRTVSITAGNTTTPNTSMATIEVPDMGYGLSFSVTNEQARRVHKGDVATVSNYYWGSTIEATLTAIKTDPKNPQTSKILEFELSGDVTAGANLTLSVGEKSAAYDYVVPKSAIRNDANGDFVLIITAKSSPLGNRYTATRVDVTVIASDDTSSAISGGIQSGDFVITTSTAPIKNGDRVRMADAA